MGTEVRPAAAGSQAARRPDRGHRPAALAHGAASRHLVASLPAGDRRRLDAGRAPCAADGEPASTAPFIAAHSTGFDQLERYVLGQDGGEARSPEWAEGLCGVAAEEITRFARAYAAAKPAMLLPGYSIQRVFAGEEPYRLAVALQLATGNFGRLGGSTGALNNRLPCPGSARCRSPILPDSAHPAPPALARCGPGGRAGGYPTDIHAIYSIGGNFLNQGGHIAKSIAAFEKVDFAVCHELFLTPTARYCDVVLPAAHALEKEDIGLPWLRQLPHLQTAGAAAQGEARTRLRHPL